MDFAINPLASLFDYLQDNPLQSSHEDSYDFLLYLKLDKRKKINEEFLKKIGANPSKIFEELSHKDHFLKQKLGGSSYRNIEPRFQSLVVDSLVLNTCAQRYELHECNWQPPIASIYSFPS